VSVIEPGELRLTHYLSGLASAAYANLGVVIIKRAEFKGCLECGRVFPPSSSKQRYHDEACATRTWYRGEPRGPQRGCGEILSVLRVIGSRGG
jgi:hypothetical protein